MTDEDRCGDPRVLGLLSDSHGRAAITGRAVAALLEAGADTLIHLGDVGNQAVIDELVGFRAHVVFGNCDLDEIELGHYAELVGVQVDHPIGELTIGDRRIAYTHGHLDQLISEALSGRPDYFLHGHSHQCRDEMCGDTRIINPGALFRAARYTAAILDPANDRLQVLEISKDP